LENGTLDLTRVNHLLAVLSRKKQLLEQVVGLLRCSLQCFDNVSWASGRASGL